MDVDPVSLILVPHLDRIYVEMGRLCGTRDDDLHRWINPEMYGWWVGRGERHGEASLLFAEFASRLFVFHYDPLEIGDTNSVPEAEITRAVELARGSWAIGL